MNKHLLKALRAWAHPAFIQTAAFADDADDARMALDIRLMDRDREGNRTAVCETRYVRISDSSGNSDIYPLCLDNGEAYLRLEDRQAGEVFIEQCDETGRSLTDDDGWTITYRLNGTMINAPGVRIKPQSCGQCVEVINMPNEPITLHITKTIVNEFQEPIDYDHDMEFALDIKGCGVDETVVLNMDNEFHAVLTGLRPGTLSVRETKQPCYVPTYVLDGNEWDGCAKVIERCGDHMLEVINHKHTANVLMLDQFVRRDDGELVKPGPGERFTVWISCDDSTKQFILDDSHHFSLHLYDLPGGHYQVRVSDAKGRMMTYMVNAQAECDTAQFTLGECEESSVLIIADTPLPAQNSPLRICKYIRSCEGEWRKPNAHEHFKVMLSGCGVREIFNLNAHNNFCVDIGHICSGSYEVKELEHSGYVPSYIVNDGGECTSAKLWIEENSCNCVTILNEEKNKGALTISKMIREGDGSLVKPEKTARFLITLRSYFTRETYVLDAGNDFCVHIHHLKEGSYEVKEQKVNGYDTTYIVNGGKEETKARLVVKNGTNADVKIINSTRREISGDLRITKFIANAFHDYVKPNADEEFMIHVEGPCLDSCYTLRSTNSWCITLEGLKKGVYRISEAPQGIYDTQYFVNGNEMSEAALVCMDHQNQEVTIVNTKKSYGNLKLNIMVEECDQHLRRPNQTEFFDVIMETGEGSQLLHFDQRNNFGILLEDLPCGKVRITQKDNYGYRVVYDVNGMRQNHADVIMNGTNSEVTIVNQMMGCSGVVTVRKLVKTLHGKIVEPCAQDGYSFTLTSRCIHETYDLCEKNNFRVLFDDLEEGEYEIQEVPVTGMLTRYRINGKECESGRFTLDRDDVAIDIINIVQPLPKLSVHKRIRRHGVLEKPQCHEEFHFQLIGRDVHETYCLNEANDWCVTLDNLQPRHYEIRELHQDTNVYYQIGDCLYEQGTFLFGYEDQEITIINEAGSDALVRIAKLIRDERGNCVKPCPGEHFDIVLESDCYKQCFTLDERNDWCVEWEGLPQGCYSVKERDAQPCELLINGVPSRDGKFDLEDEDRQITLINSKRCANTLSICANVREGETTRDPQSDARYHITVEHEGVCDTFVLDRDNDWWIELADIEPGNYRISSAEPLLYEVDGEWFKQCVTVKLGCDDVAVNVWEEAKPQRNIEISLWIQERDGTLHLPLHDANYSLLVCGCQEECFELDAANDWSVKLCDYPSGEYEVIAMDVDHVRYQVDDQLPQRQGIVSLKDRSVALRVLIQADHDGEEEKEPTALLRVHAMVQNCAGELESAPEAERFVVMIDGHQVQEDVVLTHRNGFQREFRLLPCGAYTITQEPNDHFDTIMYRINGKVMPKAEITLAEEEIQVDIINYRRCATGSIHVMKYISDASCGCLKRPCMDESYTITLCGEAKEQSVVLNASNHWSYRFDDLPLGRYTIIEAGEQPTFIINGGKETSVGEVELTRSDANVKVINALDEPAHSFGSIELCKYVKDENGREQAPDPKDSFWITVKGDNDVQRILLHAANHFYALIPHLANGTYEITEESTHEVSYRIDGGKVCEQAVVTVNGSEHRVDILNSTPCHGNMTLTKFFKPADGSLRRADGGSWRVHISAPGYNKVVTLNAANRYSVVLANLKKGLYVVDELDHDDVTYRIDNGSEVDRAVVAVSGMHEVMIINTHDAKPKGSLHMTKYLRNAFGQLIRPNGNASYPFHISKPGYDQLVTLNRANQWMMTLSDLDAGNYVIQELGEHSVSYIINDHSECDYGIVAVAGNENTVSIINHEEDPQGRIRVNKYVRNDQGELVKPKMDQRYQVHISRPGYNEILSLTADNHWSAEVNDLPDGDYVLDEVDAGDEVTWRIDGGYEVSYAIVSVAHNDHQVDMINHQTQSAAQDEPTIQKTSPVMGDEPNNDDEAMKNTLYLYQFVSDGSNQLRKPDADQVFRVLLTGNRTHQFYTLSRDNDWHTQVENLRSGDYEIIAQGSGETKYMVNGADFTDTAEFHVAPGRENTVEIVRFNHVEPAGTLVLEKRMRKGNGELTIPDNDESFRIRVVNQAGGYDETFTLDALNGYTIRIASLSDGAYQLTEIDNNDYDVSFIVDGSRESQTGTVQIDGPVTHQATIINTETSLFFHIAESENLQVVIE